MVMYKLKIRGEYMSMNKCKIIGILLLSFCIGFFINTSDVKAIGTPDGNGYADCEYSYTVAYGAYDSSKRQYVTVITAFRNTEGNYDAYINTMACGNPTNSQSTWQENKCSVKNVQELFYNSDTVKSKFTRDGKWVCPTIFLKNPVSGNDISDSVELKYERTHSSDMEMKRVEDRSQDSGTPPNHSGEYDGQQTSDVHDDIKDQRLGDKANKDEIKRWGENNSNANELGEVGDSCSLVSSNTWLTTILKFILWGISIAAILVLIIMTIIDFVKAITASDDGGLKKAFQHLIKRAIATIILLLLPALLGWIIDIINDNAPEVGEIGVVQIADDGSKYCGVVD